MAIWHSSAEKPSYEALATLIELGKGKSTETFKGNEIGKVINKTDEFLDNFFLTHDKKRFTVSVNVVSHFQYELQI